MQIRQVIEKFEENYPISLNEAWDNSGLQVGDIDQELKNIMVTLEITPESIDYAVDNDINLILCHHPIIFPNISSLDQKHFKGKKLLKAIKNDIVIYASHSPADTAGFNEYIFNRMGFQSQGKIDYTDQEKNLGYGDFADVDIKLKNLVDQIKDNLDLDHVIVYEAGDKFKRIGLVTGTGMSFRNQIESLGIDVFITGDINHHEAMDFMEKGVTLIDISHEGSEKYFTYLAEDAISDLFDQDDPVKIHRFYNPDKYLRKIF